MPRAANIALPSWRMPIYSRAFSRRLLYTKTTYLWIWMWTGSIPAAGGKTVQLVSEILPAFGGKG